MMSSWNFNFSTVNISKEKRAEVLFVRPSIRTNVWWLRSSKFYILLLICINRNIWQGSVITLRAYECVALWEKSLCDWKSWGFFGSLSIVLSQLTSPIAVNSNPTLRIICKHDSTFISVLIFCVFLFLLSHPSSETEQDLFLFSLAFSFFFLHLSYSFPSTPAPPPLLSAPLLLPLHSFKVHRLDSTFSIRLPSSTT